MAHHHVAIGSHVLTDVVIPLVVVTVPVAHDDERELPEARDVGGVVGVLTAHAPEGVDSLHDGVRTGKGDVSHHIEASLITEPVDVIRCAELPVAVDVNHHVIADPDVGREGPAQGPRVELEGVPLDVRSVEGERRRRTADVYKRRIARPAREVFSRHHVDVCRHSGHTGLQPRVHSDVHALPLVDGADVLEPGILTEGSPGELFVIARATEGVEVHGDSVAQVERAAAGPARVSVPVLEVPRAPRLDRAAAREPL